MFYLKRKNIIIIVIIILFIVFNIIRFFIFAHSCNRVFRICEDVLGESTVLFNKDNRIKYHHLSNKLKKYIDKEAFKNIVTWEDTYNIFKDIPKSNVSTCRINRYSFEYYIYFPDDDNSF